jgi:hypothetical protein
MSLTKCFFFYLRKRLENQTLKYFENSLKDLKNDTMK